MGWKYSSIPKHQQRHHLNLGMDKYFNPTLLKGSNLFFHAMIKVLILNSDYICRMLWISVTLEGQSHYYEENHRFLCNHGDASHQLPSCVCGYVSGSCCHTTTINLHYRRKAVNSFNEGVDALLLTCVVGVPGGRWAILLMAEIPRLTVVMTSKSGQQGL